MSEFYRCLKSEYGVSGLQLDAADLRQINQHTTREFSESELFAFKATACDNEIDRDVEAFDAAALKTLAGLLIGKPIIMDHKNSAENQCARIYAAKVVQEDGKTTSYGEPYRRLEIRCYMPRNEDTRDKVALIESGILKEVSVGCAVKENICSICGKSYWDTECTHRRREIYDGKACFVYLSRVVDAYEVSFVAVPAQPAAGVTKEAREKDPARAFRAELMGLADLVKGIGAEIRKMSVEKNPPACTEPPAQDGPPEGGMDQETAELIAEAHKMAARFLDRAEM